MAAVGWPLIIWTATCIGLGLVGSDDTRKIGQAPPWVRSFGYATLVWAAGLIVAFQFARML